MITTTAIARVPPSPISTKYAVYSREDRGDGGDDAGVHAPEHRPAPQKACERRERVAQEDIEAAGLREGGRELAAHERAKQRQYAARQPHQHDFERRAQVACDFRGLDEDRCADDGAGDHRDGVDARQGWMQLRQRGDITWVQGFRVQGSAGSRFTRVHGSWIRSRTRRGVMRRCTGRTGLVWWGALAGAAPDLLWFIPSGVERFMDHGWRGLTMGRDPAIWRADGPPLPPELVESYLPVLRLFAQPGPARNRDGRPAPHSLAPLGVARCSVRPAHPDGYSDARALPDTAVLSVDVVAREWADVDGSADLLAERRSTRPRVCVDSSPAPATARQQA